MVNVNDFKEERSCIYKSEEYLARDNGAVLRKARPNQRVRKLDNKWTFGKLNIKTGYLEIASVRVHRIVALAFHGEPPTKEHIVDHIDTNRQNNRPTNLRWITRLENVVLNEVTRKRIEYRTGVSIYEFLENPAKYRDAFDDPDFSWMRRVTKEEAQICLENVAKWAKEKPKAPKKTTSGIGEWIYHPRTNTRVEDDLALFYEHEEKDNVCASLTPMAKQRDWTTPTEFVCCPTMMCDDPISAYLENMAEGKVLSVDRYGESKIVKFVKVDQNAILAITSIPSGIKSFALVKITYENGYYVHTNMGSFVTDIGAEKYYTLAQGLEWTGEECPLDDNC